MHCCKYFRVSRREVNHRRTVHTCTRARNCSQPCAPAILLCVLRLQGNVAAGLLLESGWDPETQSLADPMCGSGTPVTEAALIAMRRAPGLLAMGTSGGESLIVVVVVASGFSLITIVVIITTTVIVSCIIITIMVSVILSLSQLVASMFEIIFHDHTV